jgi:hypothetical protein
MGASSDPTQLSNDLFDLIGERKTIGFIDVDDDRQRARSRQTPLAHVSGSWWLASYLSSAPLQSLRAIGTN